MEVCMNAFGETLKHGSETIAAGIRRDILNGQLLAPEKLPAERELAKRFSVSRGTVRSALAKLESEKFVEIRPGSGAFIIYKTSMLPVSEVKNANPLELIDARFALEPHICRLAVLHGKRDQFEKLETLIETMERSVKDPIQFSSADTAFHQTLSDCTGNNLLIWIINQINSVRGQDEWTRARHQTLNNTIIRTYNIQHRQILVAIKAREPERAASLMKEHLEIARLSLTRAAGT